MYIINIIIYIIYDIYNNKYIIYINNIYNNKYIYISSFNLI